MANRDNRNKHNRGGYKSIGSQVGGALGGHLSSQGKLGGGAKKGGNFSFDKFGKFVGNFFTKPGYAQTMGDLTGNVTQLKEPSAWKIKQFADKNIDITKMNKSFRVDIDTQRAINKIENEKVRNWLNKYAPQSVKDLKINHQMYSPTKIKPTDPRYKPTGTGSIKLDPDTEKYLEWMARANPQGNTISDYEKRYAKSIAAGYGLKEAMRHNPAETGNFYALIDDKETTPKNTTTNDNKMAFDWAKYGVTDARTGGSQADIKHNIDRLYQTTVGRNADSAGSDYWASKIAGGTNDYSTLMSGLTGSKEYKDRAAAVKANPNVTEAQLDALPSAYVSAFHPGSGSAVAGWKPGDKPTQATAAATQGNYSDATNKNVGQVNAANNVIDSTGGVGTIGGVQGTGAISGPGQGQSPAAPAAAAGLTQADLDKWWAGIDKSAWTGGGTKQSSKWDDFTSFMSALGPLMGGGGGYNYPSMGYGGYAPGGVAAANPYGNMMNFMNAFKSVGGGGGSGAGSISSSSLTK